MPLSICRSYICSCDAGYTGVNCSIINSSPDVRLEAFENADYLTADRELLLSKRSVAQQNNASLKVRVWPSSTEC